MKNKFNIKNVDNMKFSKHIEIKVFVLYFLVLCLGCFSVFLFVKGIKAEKEYKFLYHETSNIDYKVYLKDNEYFDEPFLESGRKYIASIIDNISIDFSYDVLSEDKISGDNTYSIVARLEAKEKGTDAIIWSKEQTLVDEVKNSLEDTTTFNVLANTVIDYKKYNTIMNEFRSAYGVPVDASLDVILKVNTSVKHDKSNEPIPIVRESLLKIPLIEQTVDIELNSVGDFSKTNSITYTEKTWIHYLLLVCGVILFTYYVFLSFCLLKLVYDIVVTQDKYAKQLKKIFSNYNSIIVNVKDLPSFRKGKVVDVESFEELLDAQVNMNEPVLYKEIEESRKSCFMIVRNDLAFRYEMNYTDFVK